MGAAVVVDVPIEYEDVAGRLIAGLDGSCELYGLTDGNCIARGTCVS